MGKFLGMSEGVCCFFLDNITLAVYNRGSLGVVCYITGLPILIMRGVRLCIKFVIL